MRLRRANTSAMYRRWGLAFVVLVMVLCGQPGATSAPAVYGDGPYRVQMVYRTGTSLAPFEIGISGRTDDDYGMWFGIELVKSGGRWTERMNGFGAYAEMAPAPYPTIYGPPAASGLPACPDMPGCKSPVPFIGVVSYHVTPVATSRFYVVSTHADVEVDVSGPGWRIKDVPSPGVRRVFGHRANATGARTTAAAVERFVSAAAPGGRYGSAILAYVPCEQGGEGTAVISARGATVGDGMPPHELQCAGRYSYFYEYAYTPYQTTWKVAGDVIGVGSMISRLFVFDFPKP
jgi:hypothetical protein